jgi:hypothetical protein
MHSSKRFPQLLIIFIVIFFTMIPAIAQELNSDGSEKNDDYGKGGKKIRRVSDEGRREEILWFDPSGQQREMKLTYEEGSQKIVTHEFRDCNGRKTYFERTITKLKNGEELFYSQYRFEKDGKETASGYMKRLNEKGEELISIYNQRKLHLQE